MGIALSRQWVRGSVVMLMGMALIAISGCKTVTAPQTPGAMNVYIRLDDYGQGTTPVVVRFSTASFDTVEFVSGETVACDGTFLAYDSGPIQRLVNYGAYTSEVARQPANGAYTIAYTPAHAAAITIPVKVVNAPVKAIQPVNGATVAIPTTDPLKIQYQPSGLDNTTILAIAQDSRNHITFTLPLGETGTLSVQASQFSGFQPGPGTLSLVRVTTIRPGGTPFRSVQIDYENIAKLQIVWQ
ncbi:MAG: hypothetical protein OJF49_001467 [Ktedonobacterales bacterium]|jgi:hypothetical protein|nr:MAG: hypothetical protein OJF49_001467 [Ktedonobacterales bacterium]